jgi:hypothetical protein
VGYRRLVKQRQTARVLALIFGVVALNSVVGCSDDSDRGARDDTETTSSRGASTSVTTSVTSDLTFEPPTPQPGEEFQVSYPEGTERGIPFLMQTLDLAGAWITQFVLISDGAGTEPYWLTAEDAEWVDIGVGGDLPDALVIPEVAAPGRYRICTANIVPPLCGEIEVVL